MNLGVQSTDERRIEVLAQDLPCFNGAQLAIDITMRSAPGASREAQPGATEEDGAVLVQAHREKEATYPELEAMPTRCGRNRDRRAMERRGDGTSLAARTRQGTRGTSNVGSICCTRLGAPVDADARNDTRSRLRRIAGCTK